MEIPSVAPSRSGAASCGEEVSVFGAIVVVVGGIEVVDETGTVALVLETAVVVVVAGTVAVGPVGFVGGEVGSAVTVGIMLVNVVVGTAVAEVAEPVEGVHQSLE